MTTRLAPDRMLTYWPEVLAAETLRQCAAEWAAYVDGQGTRREACERMAILVDLARQQCALQVQRTTGREAPPWKPAAERRSMANVLEVATWDDRPTLPDPVRLRIRTEVMHPYHQHTARGEHR